MKLIGFLFLALCSLTSSAEENISISVTIPISDQTTNSINPDGPRMPSNSVEAIVTPPIYNIVWVKYRVVIEYKKNGRSDSAAFEKAQNVAPASTVVVPIDYAGQIIGGVMNCYGWARLSNGQVVEGACPQHPNIIGENPTSEMIKDYLKSTELLAVASYLSGLRMFDPVEPYFKQGYGIFQISNASTAEAWNWKENCNAGRANYDRKVIEAKDYPNKLRVSDPKKYKGLPDFTTEQAKLAAYQSYSQSNEPYFVAEKKWKWKWTKNKKADGTAEAIERLEKGS